MNKKQYFEVKTLTSNEAEQLLIKTNHRNRKYSQRTVSRYAEQMKKGEWQENTGELIKISENNILLDGQHRLMAQAKAGVTLRWWIAYGLKEKTFEVIDTGKSRVSGDALHVLGVKDANSMAAIIRNYLLFEAGIFDPKIGRIPQSSISKIVEIYQKNPLKWDVINKKSRGLYLSSNRILKQGYIGGWYSFLMNYEENESEIFFGKLCAGIDLHGLDDPILVFRNILLQEKSMERRLTGSAKNAYMIITWNNYLQKKKYKRIPYVYGKTKFPVLYKTKDEAMKASESSQ